jgi:hypothetical protein
MTARFISECPNNSEAGTSGMNTNMEMNDAITLRDGVYYVRLALPWVEAPIEIALHGIATIADALAAYAIFINSTRMSLA